MKTAPQHPAQTGRSASRRRLAQGPTVTIDTPHGGATRRLFEDARQQMLALPRPVQLWMRWLNVVFLPGLFFAGNHDGARWALAAYGLALPLGVLVFLVTRRIRLTGLPHVILWTPLLIGVPHLAAHDPGFRLASPYAIWLGLLGPTILVSVLFDIREVWIALARRGDA